MVKAEQVSKGPRRLLTVCFIQQAVTKLSLLLAQVAVLTIDCVHKLCDLQTKNFILLFAMYTFQLMMH